MTQTDKLAGRALDAAVAEQVMGLNVVAHDYPYGLDPRDGYIVPNPEVADEVAEGAPWFYNERGPVYLDPICESSPTITALEVVPFYSRDIAEAWQVHLKMISDWDTLWDYAREMNALAGILGARKADVAMGLLKSLTPENICRAALAAVGVKDGA